MDTIQILIADKAELEANVKKFREDIANLTGWIITAQVPTTFQFDSYFFFIFAEENSLLKNNRNGSNAHRERTCACTDRVFLAEVERKSLSDKLSNLRDERDKLKIDCIDLKQEVLELKSKVDVSDKKSIFLAQQLQETVTKLELAEVNLSQLRAAAAAVEDGTGADENANNEETGKKEEEESKAMLEEKEGEIQRLVKENEGYVQRVADLTAYIQQASHDREQIIQQYTTYSQQLTVQIEELTKQLNDKATENHSYATREADLVGHVQRLEAQLQTNPTPRKSPERNDDPDREKELKILRTNISELDQKVLALQLERDELQERHRQDVLQLQASLGKCTALEETVGQLNTQLEMSKDSTSMQNLTHHEDLVAASTSDKVAASRAMKQNQILKKQIEEIEFSLIQSANDKAKIMNELDAAQSKAKKSADLEHDLKQQLQGMNEAVKERDRNLAAMKEQIKYYVAFAEHSISNPKPASVSGNADSESQENSSLEHVNNLVKDLQEAKAEIQSLSSVNLELKSQLDSMASSTSSSSSEDISATEVIQVTTSNGGGEEKDEKNEEISESSSGSTNGSPQIKLPKEVALMKVEQKFSQAMHQIAELSAEKEQLEHLVVRLQDETDTVGEYITIYQHQRAKQKEQLQEKERQLQAVARDREELKGKLCQLQGLLTEYMANGNGSNDNAGVCEVAQEAVPTDDDQKTEEGLTSSDNISPAGQIMNLLTEIGSNDMLQSKYDAKFQPWFWEPSSGRLIHI